MKLEDLNVVALGEVQVNINGVPNDKSTYRWILLKQEDTDHYVLTVTGLSSYLWASLWSLITELSSKAMGFSDPEVCIVSPLDDNTLLLAIHSKKDTHVTAHTFSVSVN
jgi:hypothetical protein